MWREEKIRFYWAIEWSSTCSFIPASYLFFSFLLNAKLFVHNLATSQTFFFLIMKSFYTNAIFILSLPLATSSTRCVRTIFIHCQSWFFDLFFICFKLNLQVLEREYIIKYAKVLFLDQLSLPVARQRNEITLDGPENAQLSSACAFNYDVRRDGNLFSGQTQIFIFWSWFSILGSLQVHLLIRSCFSS